MVTRVAATLRRRASGAACLRTRPPEVTTAPDAENGPVSSRSTSSETAIPVL